MDRIEFVCVLVEWVLILVRWVWILVIWLGLVVVFVFFSREVCFRLVVRIIFIRVLFLEGIFWVI